MPFETISPARLLKIELHAHSDLDPSDAIPYSTRELIDCAATLGYSALALTLHDRYFDMRSEADFAHDRGMVLLSGIERTIGGKHLLLINFSDACARVQTFEDVVALRAAEPRGLVVAPHPLFPNPTSMGQALLDRHAALIDAVEVNAMYTPLIDFNRAAIRWARRAGKPLVGNSDLHLLDQLGRTYSLVSAEPSADAICEAIRAGRVEVQTGPMSLADAGWTFGRMVVRGARGRARRLLARG